MLNTALEYQKTAIKLIWSDKDKLKENTFTYQNMTHKQCIDRFISMLNFLLQWIPTCKMDPVNLDLMYKTFVEWKATEYDADQFFEFFSFDEFDISQEKKKNMLSAQVREHLFREVLAHEDMISTCSMMGF